MRTILAVSRNRMKLLAFALAGFFFLTANTTVRAQAVNSQDRDIGAVAVAGSAANSSTSGFTIRASGDDIWGTADEFHYVYFPLDGDMELIAEVIGVDFTDSWAKAGLMARESLNANSRNVLVFVSPAGHVGLQGRLTTGGTTAYTPGDEPVGFPYWLKLVRGGNTFSGYQSEDGFNWSLVGTATVTLPSTIYVGLAVT